MDATDCGRADVGIVGQGEAAFAVWSARSIRRRASRHRSICVSPKQASCRARRASLPGRVGISPFSGKLPLSAMGAISRGRTTAMIACSMPGPPRSTGTCRSASAGRCPASCTAGAGLGGMWGAIGTSVVYTGPDSDPYASVVGVNTVGGWSQLKFKPASKWEINGAFGEENPFAADLLQNADPTLSAGAAQLDDHGQRDRPSAFQSAAVARVPSPEYRAVRRTNGNRRAY